MKIEYSRNLLKSHMVLEHEKEIETWETEMIANSQLEGILFGSYVRENEVYRLWFDITGKQALDVVLDTKELDHDMICRFMTELYDAIENIEAHLLCTNALLFAPECIFWDHRKERFYFCYYPDGEEMHLYTFTSLIEYLLTKIDHKDEKAVQMGYDLYNRVRKEDFTLLKLPDILCMDYEREEINAVPLMENGVSEKTQNTISAESEHEGHLKRQMFSKDKKQIKQEECEGNRGRQRLGLLREELKKNIMEKLNSWKPYKRPFSKEETTYIFEPEEEPEEKNMRPTVLLSEINKGPKGILSYEGNGICSDLHIETVPFIIGNNENCSGYIPSNTVSRSHARITRADNIYFIEDLNSSNGTFVGGTLLDCKTKCSLQKNEIVMFADEKFRFI